MKIPFKNRKILIIGGFGFIGHNLALKLKKLGAKVSIIDNLQVNNLISIINDDDKLPNPGLSQKIINERIELIKKAKIPFYIQDARNYHEMSALFSKIKPKVVIHLAAVSHANRSNKDPHSTFDHSLRTLENSLDNSKNVIEHFIYFSSSMVYGNFNNKKVNEKTICNPIGIYGALKFSGEKIVIAYNQAFNLPYTIIRPSALYGERCISRRVGQIFIENALNNKDLTITGNGEDKLDFTYIDDLIQGVVKTIENKKSINQIFNITYGSARKISDLIKLINKKLKQTNVKRIKKDILVPERGTLSIDKAKKLINYKSNWPIEKGYIKYIEWYKNIFKKY
tara:strand:- start:67 stop:1083 length:1017 start_codon:yes stop_codon:yes gene_type:complete